MVLQGKHYFQFTPFIFSIYTIYIFNLHQLYFHFAPYLNILNSIYIFNKHPYASKGDIINSVSFLQTSWLLLRVNSFLNSEEIFP